MNKIVLIGYLLYCFLFLGCYNHPPTNMVKMVVADFEQSNQRKTLSELFYQVYDSGSLRTVESLEHKHLEVIINTHNPDYFIVGITPGSKYYYDKERVPYDVLKTDFFTYFIIDYVSKPSDEVIDELEKMNLITELDATKRVWISDHVTAYYYFVCRNDPSRYQKQISLDLIPEEKLPKDLCND